MRSESQELTQERTQNLILQFSDVQTGRRCAVRLDRDDAGLTLSSYLDKYLRNCPVRQLLDERRITQSSMEVLQDLQDFVFVSSDDGRLGDVYSGISFKQGDRNLEPDAVPLPQETRIDGTPVSVIDLSIDRAAVGYERNWTGFHRRRWDRHPDVYNDFVRQSLGDEHTDGDLDKMFDLENERGQWEMLRSLSRKIWSSEFENYSRFVGQKRRFKTGDETVQNIIDGSGGICSEKVQAMKFLTDHYGLRSEYVIAGADARDPVPEGKLRELLDTFDFRFTKRYMRYWQHTALLYTIGDSEVLVDVTNGNIPYLFLKDSEADKLLGYEEKCPVTARMGIFAEDFYYHRVSQHIPEDLFFAMETWVEEIDLIQVFENELGLYISSDFFVTPIPFRSVRAYQRLKAQYTRFCEESGLTCSISELWSLDTPLGDRLSQQEPATAEKILQAHEHLLLRYDEFEGSGHDAGLAVIDLRDPDAQPSDA